MKTYMPKGRRCIFFNFKGKLTCLKGIPKNQPCAKLPEKLLSFYFYFFKMARKRAHEVRTAITSNLPVVSRSDFFLNMIHAETRSR